ncbi:hypothetical protein [Streptomyces jumonjinensis]|uniref:Uncharacterized protein n=1 Tax=Streptomyces jumonjinensis TaxID=1945 RepID=A0A646KL62_STRJU|nr:hypothetical protein [Streptomyces jumonjinensis]MQT03059.1 hypothetical protein [Streptomyces jumonjinensis]
MTTTWLDFTSLLVKTLGPESVEVDTEKGTTMTAVFEQSLKLSDGTTKKRYQDLHFEYDGENADWIAVTSFIGPADRIDIPALLAFLGEDWKLPAVVVDEQLALRHHFGLPETDGGKGTEAVNKEVLDKAFASAVVVGSLADFLEAHIMEQDEE